MIGFFETEVIEGSLRNVTEEFHAAFAFRYVNPLDPPAPLSLRVHGLQEVFAKRGHLNPCQGRLKMTWMEKSEQA